MLHILRDLVTGVDEISSRSGECKDDDEDDQGEQLELMPGAIQVASERMHFLTDAIFIVLPSYLGMMAMALMVIHTWI